jgi:hypothetical protein
VFSFVTAAIMQDVILVGIDPGEHGFHVHGQDRHGKSAASATRPHFVLKFKDAFGDNVRST